jgi:hypothetical protein
LIPLGEPFRAIEVPADADLADREFYRVLNQYRHDRYDGSMSAFYRDFELPWESDGYMRPRGPVSPQQQKIVNEYVARIKRLNVFGPGVKNAFVELASNRHALSLQCLGHIYRFGIGVEIDLASAWAYYDTYNLVAGIDGKDQFRDSVERGMTDLQILAGQGLARTYRDVYTDAWKVPSTTIIN